MRIGIELVVATFIGAGLGMLADKKLGTTPWLTLVGFIIGSAAGIRNVMRLANQMGQPVAAPEKEGKADESPDGSDRRD
ncbi:MAG: AtpZ/AtpI family protein [Nitrospirota bacterium]|nr:AtpZ/AtpI family protein [Nitrospirota bacterium]